MCNSQSPVGNLALLPVKVKWVFISHSFLVRMNLSQSPKDVSTYEWTHAGQILIFQGSTACGPLHTYHHSKAKLDLHTHMLNVSIVITVYPVR